ncbi:kinase-like domain-containing protein [Camillea tinctor]|nr:kinase-like domain-containing protein [Camillea tinctor]
MDSHTGCEEIRGSLVDGPSPPKNNRRSRSVSYDSLFDDPDTQLDFDNSSSSAQGARSNQTPLPRPRHSHGSDLDSANPWVRDGLSLRPEWTVEPAIEAIIATLKTTIGRENEFHVEHIHSGTHSKLYRVSYNQQCFVMRISLPVCPASLTESEVATLDWVYQNSKLPVPRVKCYDSTRNNALGFEWILMDHMDGTPLSQCWREISFEAKERIVRQIAAYATSAFEKQFTWGIGNMYPGPAGASNTSPQIGETWTASRLRLLYSDLMFRMRELKNEDHRQTMMEMLVLVERLEALEGRFFHGTKTPVPTMLWHDNISLDNLLVDENGVLCGVLDWQCVSCLPLHDTCQFPAFLQQSSDRYDEPVMIRYLSITSDGQGQLDATYWRHLKQFEITRLRLLFVDEMKSRCPGFVNAWMDKGALRLRDYEAAVQNCDNEYAYDIVRRWVEATEKSYTPESLGKRLHECLME